MKLPVIIVIKYPTVPSVEIELNPVILIYGIKIVNYIYQHCYYKINNKMTQKLIRFEEETKAKLEERINEYTIVSLSVLQTKTGFEAWIVVEEEQKKKEDLAVGFE